MKQSKYYFFSALFLFFIFTFLYCGSSKFMLVDESVLKNDINSILVLPVYTNKDLIPRRPAEFDYNKNFRETFYKAVAGNKRNLDEVCIDVLKNSSLNFKVIYKPDESLVPDTEVFTHRDKFYNENYSWPGNFSHYLKKSYISSIAKAHNVDAVLFQFLQVRKTWVDLKFNDRKTYILPAEKLFYYIILYDKNGKKLYAYFPEAFHNENSGFDLHCSLEYVHYKDDKPTVSKVQDHLIGQSVASSLRKESLSNRLVNKMWSPLRPFK